ncbi:MAG: bile acid:sodium symporter family protein [Deferribacteres bacterium]|nr:bile acid:sodium symporter family protein [candidate division KSB1 bacterium]MCB9504413.1 bile acid:sodium symporter family protein [Deferribacteres bacterium]
MESSILSAVILPLALATIMIGIGLELKKDDFLLLFQKPKSVIAGLIAQMLLLPLLGILVGFYLFDFSSPLIGAGFVIIALSPGGVTSNLFTLLAKGDLALAVTLTVIVSVITPFWFPVAAALILTAVEGADAIKLDILKTIIELFAITLIPIVIGMFIKYKNEAFAVRMQKMVKTLSTIFLVLVIVALVIKHRDILMANLVSVAPASLLLVVLAFVVGLLVAKIFSTTAAQSRAISISVGIQNGTLALYIAATILGIPELTLAAMFYSLIMFVVGFAAVTLFNKYPSLSGENAVVAA